MIKKSPAPVEIDYRSNLPAPAWVREVIEAQLAIDSEDAKSAGQLGFLARAMVQASMPYKNPRADSFTRVNGDFKLRMVAGYEGGLPYGIYPRFMLSWITTEAVRTKAPVIELGENLTVYLREVLDVRGTGGSSGTITRVADQAKRLFGSLITASNNDTTGTPGRSFQLRNILIAEGLDLDEADFANKLANAPAPSTLAAPVGQSFAPPEGDNKLWTPQSREEAGRWRSKVKLSDNFFQECVTNPVPIDLRAYRALRSSPMAMDIYTWLTYRMSYTQKKTRPIPWAALMGQFGSGYSTDRALLDFKKAFLKNLKMVLTVYNTAKVEIHENGVVLLPSPTHIAPTNRKQLSLL